MSSPSSSSSLSVSRPLQESISVRDVLLAYTSQGLTIEDIDIILKNCNFRPSMPWRHVFHGRWPPYTNRANWNRLNVELFKYNITLQNSLNC